MRESCPQCGGALLKPRLRLLYDALSDSEVTVQACAQGHEHLVITKHGRNVAESDSLTAVSLRTISSGHTRR